MILEDNNISFFATQYRMIEPFESKNVRMIGNKKLLSYGLSAFGYDIRISDKEFKIYDTDQCDKNERELHLYQAIARQKEIVNPKNFSGNHLKDSKLYEDDNFGKYFILPAHKYALAVSYEKFNMPQDVMGICVGKSTYARCGIIANITPLEPGWKGYLTIELSNSSDSDVMIFANEGIAQIIFLMGHTPNMTYSKKHGKYQDQEQKVILPKV